jgi:signal transduction histidine kinase
VNLTLSRPRFLLALAALAVCASLGAISTVRAARAVGAPYPGFVWQQHGNRVAVSIMTSSSWPAFDELNWGEILESVEGSPPAEVGAVTSDRRPGDRLSIRVVDSAEPLTVAVERFTWRRFVESFGVFLAGGMLFGICGLILLYGGVEGPEEDQPASRRDRHLDQGADHVRLAVTIGGGLLTIATFMLAGLAQASVAGHVPATVSVIVDIAWSGALAAAGPVSLLLAEAVSPGFLPEPVRRRLRLSRAVAVVLWPPALLLLRTEWGLEAAREVFLYISLCGLLLLAATARTLSRRHWLQSPTYTAAYVVAVPLMFTLIMFILLAALPWALGRDFVLPSSVLIPGSCLLPVALVYSTLAGDWLTGLKVRAAATQVMLERHKAALASTRLLLHDHVLAEMKAVRGSIAVGELEPALLAEKLLGIEARLRAQLVDLDADRPYNVPDAFPSREELRAVLAQIAPGANLEVSLGPGVESWPALVRWLFFCHAISLIRNARLHGDAANIRVALTRDHADAVLIVEDDGLGFPEDAPSGEWTPGAIGLRSAQRDIEEEGGRLTVSRSPEGGARIEERLPL